MYELVQVGANSYYIQSPAKIGVYTPDNVHVTLIDSGNDKEAGRKVRQVLDRQGWTLRAIFNTHSNADHIGGNRYLQDQTHCPIYANGMEAALTRHPLLEPALLYGGYPFSQLRHKFLLAQESSVLPLADAPLDGLTVLPLPGHFLDMVGFRTPDDTVYLADCLSSEATLEKYGVPFLYDVGAYLQTLAAVEGMRAAMFVPAHAEATADIAPLARLNREKLLQTIDQLLLICQSPVTFETVLREVFLFYGLTLNAEQYVLVGSTVRSCLAWLADAGRLQFSFVDQRMLWQAV